MQLRAVAGERIRLLCFPNADPSDVLGAMFTRRNNYIAHPSVPLLFGADRAPGLRSVRRLPLRC